jgi:hypothetical protein
MKNYIYGLLTSIILIAAFSFNYNSESEKQESYDKNESSIIKGEPEAEDIPLILKDSKPHEYYVEQARLWKIVLETDKKNENAWFNLFKANRWSKMTYNNIHSPELDWKENTEWIKEANHLLKGDDIIKQIEKNIPGTFMFYYIKFYHSKNLGDQDFHLLEKAYEINPEYCELYDDFVVHYEIANTREKRKEINIKWYKSNDFSENLLNFYYNLLTPLKQNSILFTYGDNPLMASFMLQDALSHREDVHVLNTGLLVGELEYRNAIFKRLNIPELNKTFSNGQNNENMTEIIDYIIANKPKDTPVYFGIGINNSIKKKYEDKLYLVGLALEYSETNIDNLAELINSFENKYLLDYLTIQFKYDVYKHSADVNYIHGITVLYDHYKASGNLSKTNEMKELALLIGEHINTEGLQQYKDYINYYFNK